MQTTTHSDPELGALVTEHAAAWGTRVVLFVLIAIFGGLFAALAFSQDQLVVGALLAGGSLGLMLLVQVLLSKVRLRIFVHGIERRGPLGTKRIAWNQLDSYTLQIIDTTAAAAGGAGGLLGVLIARAIVKAVSKSRDLVPNAVILLGKDQKRVVLSAGTVGYQDMIKTLVPSLVDRIFPSAREAFERGTQVSFGKKLSLQRGVGLTFTGLFGKKHVLPLEQAASARLEGTALVIRRSDSNAPWQTIQAATLQNPGVLQRFVETGGRPYDERLPMAWTS